MSKVLGVLVAAVAGLGVGAPAARATVSISGPTAAIAEGNSGTQDATFTVTRSAVGLTGSTAAVTVTLAVDTSSGPVSCPGDIAAPCTTTVSLPGGLLASTSATATFKVVGDTLDEDDEDATVAITDAGTETVGTRTATVRITDDDAPPTLAVGAASLAEGTGSAPTAFAVPLTLSAASGKPVTVRYAIAAGTAGAADLTFEPGVTKELTIPAGRAAASIPVAVTADGLDEDDETFTASLGTPANAGLAAATSATQTIKDDDTAVLSIGGPRLAEAAGNAVFPVTLSTPSAQAVTVTARTGDATAVAPGDYTATTATLTIPAGERGASFSVPVVDDAVAEPDELFFAGLSSPVGAALGDQAVAGATIVNDDGALPGTGPGSPGLGGLGGTGGSVQGNPATARLGALKLRKPATFQVTVTCVAGSAPCETAVTAFTAPTPKAKAKLLRKERKIGQRTVKLEGGKSATVSIKVPAALAAALRQNKTTKATAFAVTRDGNGNIDTKQLRGTLKG